MSTETKQVRLKFRCDGEIRLVVLPVGGGHRADFMSLQKSLTADYGFDVSLKYTDGDGDLITLASQNDLNNLLVCASNSNRTTDVFVSETLQLPEIKRTAPASSRFSTGVPLTQMSQLSKVPIIPPLFPTVNGAGMDAYRNSSTPSAKELQIKWKRGEVIGQGAFGVVYLGLNTESGELLAVKQMALDEVSVKELSQLENEINLLRSLRHSNIVRYVGTEITPTALSIFLEYIPGGSLKSLVEKFGSLEENVVRSYTRQLLLGLEYLHRNGIAHRDIKAANCLVANDGVVKLADFGASKHWRPVAVPSAAVCSHKSGDIKGTPSWMAPELVQEQGASSISWRKADVWSLACTTLEMTTGQPPWAQFDNHVTVLYHLACTDALPEYPPDASIELLTFLKMCLQRDPSRRPDITSLLMHPFVSGAGGWSSSSVRPSTVSTTPAWAWTARENPLRTPQPGARAEPTPILTSRMGSSDARGSDLPTRFTATRDGLQLIGMVKKTEASSLEQASSLSSNEVSEFGFAGTDMGGLKEKADLSDGESTIASGPTTRLRSKARQGKVLRSMDRKKKATEKKKSIELFVSETAASDADSLLEESKDSVDGEWPRLDEEILEEIEDPFDDSLELVELSTSAENMDQPAPAVGGCDDELAQEASVEKVAGGVKSSALSKSKLKPASSAKPLVASSGLRDRRQWMGTIDVSKANASTSFLESSPSVDQGNPFGFRAPPPSSKAQQRNPGFVSTPGSAQEKTKRGKTGLARSGLDFDAAVYGDSISRAVSSTAGTYFSSDVAEDQKEDCGERCRVNFLTLDPNGVQSLSEHQGAVTELFAPRRSGLLLSASTDGTVRVWSNSSTESRSVLDTGLFSVSLGGGDSTPSEGARRSLGRGQDEKAYAGPTFSAASVAVKVTHLWADDSCDTIWGGCSDNNFRVWSGVEGRPLRFIKGHDDAITCVDGMPAGQIQTVTLLASGSADRTVRIFDVRSKKPQVFLFRGHTDSVLTVKVTDGGRTIISGSKDKTIKLFDTRTGRLRASLEKHFGAVNTLRVLSDLQLGKAADGQGFVSGGRDSMLNVW